MYYNILTPKNVTRINKFRICEQCSRTVLHAKPKLELWHWKFHSKIRTFNFLKKYILKMFAWNEVRESHRKVRWRKIEIGNDHHERFSQSLSIIISNWYKAFLWCIYSINTSTIDISQFLRTLGHDYITLRRELKSLP